MRFSEIVVRRAEIERDGIFHSHDFHGFRYVRTRRTGDNATRSGLGESAQQLHGAVYAHVGDVAQLIEIFRHFVLHLGKAHVEIGELRDDVGIYVEPCASVNDLHGLVTRDVAAF